MLESMEMVANTVINSCKPFKFFIYIKSNVKTHFRPSLTNVFFKFLTCGSNLINISLQEIVFPFSEVTLNEFEGKKMFHVTVINNKHTDK